MADFRLRLVKKFNLVKRVRAVMNKNQFINILMFFTNFGSFPEKF